MDARGERRSGDRPAVCRPASRRPASQRPATCRRAGDRQASYPPRTGGRRRRAEPAGRSTVVRLTVTSALLLGAVAGCAIAIEPLVREVLDALAMVADGASWSVW